MSTPAPADGRSDAPAWTFELDARLNATLVGLGLLIALAVFAACTGLGLGGDIRPLSIALAGAATLVAHEAVHAGVLLALGTRPSFGAGLVRGTPYLYTTADVRLRPRAFLLVALAPLLVLDAGAVAGLLAEPRSSALVTVLVINSSGAVGDLWMAGLVLQLPTTARVLDQRTGFAVFNPGGLERTPRLPFLPGWTARAAGWLAVGLLILGAEVLGTVAIAALRHERRSVLALGPLVLLAVIATGAIAVAARLRSKR